MKVWVDAIALRMLVIAAEAAIETETEEPLPNWMLTNIRQAIKIALEALKKP